MAARASRRLVTIDALRGVAALAVLVHHIHHPLTGNGPIATIVLLVPQFGPLGVTLFLAISGFCIHLAARRTIHAQTGRTDWAAFWKRRVWRLYPPYVAAIALSLAIYYGTHGERYFWEPNRITNLPVDLAAHLLMIHNLTAGYSISLANGALWSIGLEEQLYALYSLYAVVRARISPLAIACITLVIAVAWRTCIVVPLLGGAFGPLGSWWTWPFSWWFSWIVGAVVAEAWEGQTALPAWLTSWPLAVALVVVAAPIYPNVVEYPPLAAFFAEHQPIWRNTSQMSELMFSMAFAIVMFKAVTWESAGAIMPRAIKWAASVGTFSYSLYLVHSPLVTALGLPGDSPLAIAARYVTLVPLSLVAGYVFYRLVERHFLTRRALTSTV